MNRYIQSLPTEADWYRRGMEAAVEASKMSHDRDTQTGCAVFEPGSWNPLTTGANRLPAGLEPTNERVTRPAKYLWLEHAERNAIYGYPAHDLYQSIVFLNWFPCCDCARALVQVGIQELVYIIKPERWADPRYQFDVSKAILEAGEVKLTPYEVNDGIEVETGSGE